MAFKNDFPQEAASSDMYIFADDKKAADQLPNVSECEANLCNISTSGISQFLIIFPSTLRNVYACIKIMVMIIMVIIILFLPKQITFVKIKHI